MKDTIVRIDDTVFADELRSWMQSADVLHLRYCVTKFITTGDVYRGQCPESVYAQASYGNAPVTFWIFRLEMTT